MTHRGDPILLSKQAELWEQADILLRRVRKSRQLGYPDGDDTIAWLSAGGALAQAAAFCTIASQLASLRALLEERLPKYPVDSAGA